MVVKLNQRGSLVRLGRTYLRTPGLIGNASILLSSEANGLVRSATLEGSTKEFEAALLQEKIMPQFTVAIRGAKEVPLATHGVRTATFNEPALELQVPDPGADWGQMVLAIDEAGVATWNFTRLESGTVDVSRGGELRTYLIPRYVPAVSQEEEPKTRGLSGALGMKLLKVLIFPLFEPALGHVGKMYAASWEAAHRPYGLRTITPENYRQAVGTPVTGEDWEKFGRGRSLLLVHGTFSRTHSAFGDLTETMVNNLYNIYEGRIFSFDHFTLSEDPRQNVRWLLERIPENGQLDLDILCHSRGGLVSRVLAEKQSEFSLGSRKLKVNRVVFVAVPNAGTILADGKYLGELLNSYTNLLNFFPSVGLTEVLEGVLVAVKMMAVGALDGLPGLRAMLPDGKFLRDFNSGPKVGGCNYYALAADYEPRDPGLAAWAKNRLMDRIFMRAKNDLVVPTAGVFQGNGSGYFPIQDYVEFPKEAGISHTTFFGNTAAQEQILRWLR